MKRWIKGWIGVAFLALALRPEKVFANENSVQVQTKVETDGWKEEYTDTDSRCGILSIRCKTFQGFHGTIELHMRNMVGGWEQSATLTEKSGYTMNLSLPVGSYEIERFEAQTDGRKYRCQADRTEVEIEDEKIIMCRVTITPDSVFRLPYEDEVVAAKSGMPVAVATRSDSNEREESEMPEPSDEERSQEMELQGSIRAKPFLILGILGAGLCLYELYYVIKRK